MTEQKNELVEVIKITGLEQNKVESLMASFSESYQTARQFVEASKSIKVADENDKDGMKKAREARLQLRKIRTDVEHTRVSLKEQSLRESRAIDGAANIIKALIVPVEEHLEQLEKMAEIAKQNRDLKVIAERTEQLHEYVADVSIYRLEPDNMSNEIFANLIAGLKSAEDAEVAARAKVEADKIAREKLEKIFSDRKFELVRYSEFVDIAVLTIETTAEEFERLKKSALEAKQKDDAEQEKIRLENARLVKEREAREIEIGKERKVQDDKLAKEKAEREKVEKQIADDKERERVRLEAEQKVKDDAERARLLAPDKEKLVELAKTLDLIILPNVSSKQAGEVIKYSEDVLNKLNIYVREKAKAL